MTELVWSVPETNLDRTPDDDDSENWLWLKLPPRDACWLYTTLEDPIAAEGDIGLWTSIDDDEMPGAEEDSLYNKEVNEGLRLIERLEISVTEEPDF